MGTRERYIWPICDCNSSFKTSLKFNEHVTFEKKNTFKTSVIS